MLKQCQRLGSCKTDVAMALCCFERHPPDLVHPAAFRITQVVDVGQVVAGNFCGALLAYFGATVIKVIA